MKLFYMKRVKMIDTNYPYSLLFVEDEEVIRENYVAYLKTVFAEVYEAKDGEEAYVKYKKYQPDIMIVDVNLPKVSGIEFLKKVRLHDHKTRSIMLTAHTDTAMLLEAASLKLTKYLTKPISRKALYETLELAIQELQRFKISTIETIVLDEAFSWDPKRCELYENDEVISLTKKEQAFLTLLCSDVSHVFSYDEIFESVWGYESIGTTDGLKSLVKGLRKKIPKESIKNVFGIGYKIELMK